MTALEAVEAAVAEGSKLAHRGGGSYDEMVRRQRRILAAAMEAYHRERLTEALTAMLSDRPPVSEGREKAIREELASPRRYGPDGTRYVEAEDDYVAAADDLGAVLAGLSHYRALALALAQDDHAGGLTEAYRAGVAAGRREKGR